MAKDEKVEAFLNSHQVKWEYHPKFKISDIDIPASRTNQARVAKPVNEDQVLVYGLAMENGTNFPAIVLHRRSAKGKAIVIDGNHRLAAAVDLGSAKTIDAYEVKGASEMEILRLTFKANEDNGLALTMDDRIRHALALVAYGASQKAAAADMGIPETRVAKELKKAEAYNRLVQVGVKGLDRLAGSTIARLGSVRSDVVLEALGKGAVTHKLGVADVDQIVTTINKERTEQGQLKLVEEEFKRREKDTSAVGGPKSPVRLPRIVTNLRRVTNGVMNLDEKDLKAIPRDLKKSIGMRCLESAEKLSALGQKLT